MHNNRKHNYGNKLCTPGAKLPYGWQLAYLCKLLDM